MPETTWTDADNCGAFEQTTITHVNRISELESQVKRLKEAIVYAVDSLAFRSGVDEAVATLSAALADSPATHSLKG